MRSNSFLTAGKPEHRLLCAQRELAALQHDYLELGLRASTLAGARDTALAALEITETYIASMRPDLAIQDAIRPPTPGRRDPEPSCQRRARPGIRQADESAFLADRKHRAGRRALDTLRTRLFPTSRLLQGELLSVRRQIAGLQGKYRELADRTGAIAHARDEALNELKQARLFAETVTASRGDHRRRIQTKDAPPDDARATLAAVFAKLNSIQGEKNDVAIKLAESEDRVTELQRQEARLREQRDALADGLSDRDKTMTAASRDIQALTAELDKARDEHTRLRSVNQQQLGAFQQRIAGIEAELDASRQHVQSLQAASTAEAQQLQARAKALALREQRIIEFRATAERIKAEFDAGKQRLVGAEHGDRARRGKTPGRRTQPTRARDTFPWRRESGDNWLRITAGFVFLVGTLASLARTWDTDYRSARHATVSKSVVTAEPGGAQQDTPPSTTTADLTSQDSTGASAQDSPAEDDVPQERQTPLQRQAREAVKSIRGVARQWVEPSEPLPLVHAYLMAPSDAADIWYDSCIKGGGDAGECEFLEKNLFKEGVVRLPSGVQYSVIKNGTGASPGPHDRVLVNFRGMLLDGSEFDSSRRRGGVDSFRVNEAIPGLQDVLQYMEEGARWEVYVPTELAFRKPAPFGGQTVVFDIELVSIGK